MFDELQGRSLSSNPSGSLHRQTLGLSPIGTHLDDLTLLASSTVQRILRDSLESNDEKSLPFEPPSSFIFPVCVPKLNQPMIGDNYVTCLAVPHPLGNNASSSRTNIQVTVSSASSTATAVESTVTLGSICRGNAAVPSERCGGGGSNEAKKKAAATTTTKPTTTTSTKPCSLGERSDPSSPISQLYSNSKPSSPSQRPISGQALKACQERLLSESRRTKLTRMEAKQMRAREIERAKNADQRPPFDIYRQPPPDVIISGFEARMNTDWLNKGNAKQIGNSNILQNDIIPPSSDSSFESDVPSITTVSSSLNNQSELKQCL